MKIEYKKYYCRKCDQVFYAPEEFTMRCPTCKNRAVKSPKRWRINYGKEKIEIHQKGKSSVPLAKS